MIVIGKVCWWRSCGPGWSKKRVFPSTGNKSTGVSQGISRVEIFWH